MEIDVKNTSLTYEVAKPENSDALVSLYREYYPTLLWSAEYLKWQYWDNPAGHAKVFVAKAGTKIIATYGAVPHRVVVNGVVKTGWRVQDALTRPEYRGFGIFHAFSRSFKKNLMRPEYPVNFTFPNEVSHAGFMRTGWMKAFKVPLKVVPVPAKDGESFSGSAVFEPLSEFSAETDAIWESFVKTYGVRFAVNRSADYLNWRYFKKPKVRYFPFLGSSGQERALLVLKVYDRENGERWAHICDYFQTGKSGELARGALDFSLQFAGENSAKALSAWIPVTNPLSEGFRGKEEDLNRWVAVNENMGGPEKDEVMKEENWHLAMGDSDVY